jgi:cytidine deaminase
MVFSELQRELPDEIVRQLFREAWAVRERAYVVGPTRVGCAVLSSDGHIFVGCNVEHRYRCHDVHAEVNAITTMISAGEKQVKVVAIAAERDRFTPCGGCMDWIMQFAAEPCYILAQSSPGGPIQSFATTELMPFYPQ